MPAEKISDAELKAYQKGREAAERLKAALTLHGITLPSLGGGWIVSGTAMVELGGCRADVAEALALVLEEKAAE
ncbi:hypothetical protein ABZZ47_11260 [Streptomyces sp. NPDC006465]|uniref:hypothetical protein n=1 Tax=Streptomyces sp. NPDC006465 TaxID=3157174 RepID=UPI0033B57B90